MLAHELGHILNRDILISSVAAVMAGAISYLASMAQWAMIFGGAAAVTTMRAAPAAWWLPCPAPTRRLRERIRRLQMLTGAGQ